MSVCAVKVFEDKIELCADTQITAGSTINSGFLDGTKIFEVNGMAVAGTGTIREINLLKLFMTKNLIGEASEENILEYFFSFQQFKQSFGLQFDLECQFILVYQGKAFSIVQGEVLEIPEYYAIGSGGDFACAALYLGHTAQEAIEVACGLNVYCHLPVKTLVLSKN